MRKFERESWEDFQKRIEYLLMGKAKPETKMNTGRVFFISAACIAANKD